MTFFMSQILTNYEMIWQSQIKNLMKKELFSKNAKMYEVCLKVKPKNKIERLQMYTNHRPVENQRRSYHSENKNYSPFNTISRQSRNSYLLRVTKESNSIADYLVNNSATLKREPRTTIDRAPFTRMIGSVGQNYESMSLDESRSRKCVASLSEFKKSKPLVVSDVLSWRKSHQNLDFEKQMNPERTIDTDKTNITAAKVAQQSQFNNYDRFSLKLSPQKSHPFNSYSGHKYLKEIQDRELEPEYDPLANNQGYLKKSMLAAKGEVRFDLFRDQIKTRKDRADPFWFQKLEYIPKFNGVDEKAQPVPEFSQNLERKDNDIHSKYPIRLSLTKLPPVNKKA